MKPLRGMAGVLAAVGCAAQAQTVSWTTNYYNVTGATIREIHRSLEQSRPWTNNFDGLTRWTVTWRSRVQSGPDGCQCVGVSTTVKITTTMPRWTAPTNASAASRTEWAQFMKRLGEHESGHARLAVGAANAVRAELAQTPPATDCPALTAELNRAGQRIVDGYRKQEQDFDRRTNHGLRPDTNAK